MLGLVKTLPPDQRPRLFAMLTNVDPVRHVFDTKRAHRMLATPEHRAQVIASLVAGVKAYGLAGITVDIEGVDDASRASLSIFVHDLQVALHAISALTLQTVASDADDAEFRDAGRNADYVIDMLYD